jgi:hypothetical protein
MTCPPSRCYSYVRMIKDNDDNNSKPNLSGEGRPNPQGLVLALQLMELGIDLARQRIVRENPGIPHAELVAKTNEWLKAPRGESR